MQLLSQFYPLIRNHVPRCPDYTLDKAIIYAAQELCSLSWALSEAREYDGEEGQDSYVLSPYSTEMEIIGVKAVEYNNMPLYNQERVLVKNEDDAVPLRWYLAPPDVVVISPAPDEDNAGENKLFVRQVLQPITDAQYLHDHLWRTFKQTISQGAIAWLTRMPDEGWTNYQLSRVYDNKFYQGVSRAKALATRDYKPGPLFVSPRTFAI